MDAVSEAYGGDDQMIDSFPWCAFISVLRTSKKHRVHCLGRSRAGLTTKIHALTDARGGADKACANARTSPRRQ